MNMVLKSPAFQDGGQLPVDHTCDGAGVSPQLDISGVPAEAQSLAIVVQDPDAPGGLFTHWVLWNIDARATTIPAGFRVPPQIKQAKNDGGQEGFLAACPPRGHGTHHYHFTLYALDAVLALEENAGRKEVESAIYEHKIAEASITAVYSR